jgi:hypothetical protein
MKRTEAVSDNFELAEEIETAGKITLKRIFDLGRKGYRPDFNMDFTEAIWMIHPASEAKWRYKSVIVYPDGKMVAVLYKKDEDFRIEWYETAKFDSFVRTIPNVTIMDRTRDMRNRIAAIVLLALIAIGLIWVFNTIGMVFTKL